MRGWWREAGIIEQAKPFDGAFDALRAVANAGHTVGLITARAWHPLARVNTHALPVSEIILLAFGESKKDLLESRAQHVGGYIDDTWRHVSDMASIGVPSALVRRAWNRPQHKLDEGIDEAQHFPDWLHARGRLGYRAKTPGYR